MNTPVLLGVRERHTPHGAESPAATREWCNAWDNEKTDGGDVTEIYDTDEEVDDMPP